MAQQSNPIPVRSISQPDSTLPLLEVAPKPEADDDLNDYYVLSPSSVPSNSPPAQRRQRQARGHVAPLAANRSYTEFKPKNFAKPFCSFLTENRTVFHTVNAIAYELAYHGFTKLSPRDSWELEKGGKYFVERNGSSLIAFTVGEDYKPGNGAAIVAGHVDALTCKLKPISTKPTKHGYVQLGVAPYAGALNPTWWDRDLSIAGRVLVKQDGKVVSKLVDLKSPIARIPTLAPHFGLGYTGQSNAETEMVPIIGLDHADIKGRSAKKARQLGPPPVAGTFAATQQPELVSAVCKNLGIKADDIVQWELQLYDFQKCHLGGLNKELIYGGRLDDNLCSWAAIQALLGCSYDSPDETTSSASSTSSSGIIKCVGLFDDEEIGSLLRQGANSNFLPKTLERVVEAFAPASGAGLMGQTYAKSFLVSADVSHAVNPNFEAAYLEHHMPRLNIGVVLSGDSNGNMTTDAVSAAILERVAEKCDSKLQWFQIRNDSRSGGTIGPMLSSALGVRSCDAGIPQLSMHSIRATTGAKDPGLGVKLFKGFFDYFEEIDKEFAA